MLPVPLTTVSRPWATIHFAGVWSCAETHSSSFLPSKRMMASEGGAPQVAAGEMAAGTGSQTSVSSGLGLASWAATRAAEATRTRVQRTADFIKGSVQQRSGHFEKGP